MSRQEMDRRVAGTMEENGTGERKDTAQDAEEQGSAAQGAEEQGSAAQGEKDRGGTAQEKKGREDAVVDTASVASDEYMTLTPGIVSGKTKIDGLRVDFNLGARVEVPEGKWRVRLIDLSTAQVVFDEECSQQLVHSKVYYYVPWRIEVWQEDKMVFSHVMNLRGKRVYVKFCSGALGDSIAWVPYVEEFRKRHGCEIWVAMSEGVGEIFREAYPELHFVAPTEHPAKGSYASYYMGCFFPPDERVFQPSSWKLAGIQGAAAHILDLPAVPMRPPIRPDGPRTIREPYVCIAAQASSQAKYWNNPEGWIKTVAWLKEQGYRVLCIDRDRCYGKDWYKNTIPYGAEDFTGERPIRERLELLAHADFFVGLASGLSWLAWGAGVPVVLISGFSLPGTEFPTPYRIINYNICNGCWEDDRYVFDHKNFHWCPRHAGDPERQFECTRKINHIQVVNACRRLMEEHHLSPGGKNSLQESRK